jgi:anti-anti-sigma factor
MPAVRTGGLIIEERDTGPVHTIALRGELDVGTAPDLAAAIDMARAHGLRRILVDLTALEFCDSTGLRALIGAAQELRIARGRLTVVCPGEGPVSRLLELTGMRETLDVYRDVAVAAASLAR